MRNPHERCERKKFVRQTKSASKAKETRIAYADSSSSSDDYPIESSDSEGSDDCPRDRSCRRGKQVKTAPISSPVEELSEGNPSEDEPVEPDDLQMPSKDYALHPKKEKNYVLQGKFDLTAAHKAKIDALDEKIRPKIPMLVVRMKKTNVKQYPDLAILKDYAVNHFPSKTQTITLKLHGKSKEWLCDFRIIPDEKGHHLYLHEFVHDNNVREGDLCLFQPVTKGDVRNFKVTVHHLREADVDHSSVERNDIGTNDGSIQEKSADSVDIRSTSEDDTKQPSGRELYPSCQRGKRGSSKDHRNTAKKAAKPTPFEKSGDDSPLAYNSVESNDCQTPRGHNYALSLGSCLSVAQYEKVIALLVERIQPETAVYVDVMSQRAVQLPSPLLIIPEEHAIAHFPNESATIALEGPEKKSKKWQPRFYMTKDRSEYMLIGHWFDFVYDNSLQEGDICIFVPEKGGARRSKFTVHVLRRETSRSGGGTVGVQAAGSGEGENASSESNMHRVSHEPLERKNSDGFIQKIKKSAGLVVPPYILPSMTHLSLSQENIVEKKVQAIQSEVPIYVSIMKKSCIGAIKHNMLELSSRYAAAAHLPRKNQIVVLQCKSRIWKTKMVVHRSGKRWFLSAGWSKFVHDNSLQLGDICLFELKKNNRKPTMKVHIIPSKQC